MIQSSLSSNPSEEIAALAAQQSGRFSLWSVLKNGFSDNAIAIAACSSSLSLAKSLASKIPEFQVELSDAVGRDVQGLLPMFRVIAQPISYIIRSGQLSSKYAQDINDALRSLTRLGYLAHDQMAVTGMVTPLLTTTGTYALESYALTEKGKALLDFLGPLNILNTSFD